MRGLRTSWAARAWLLAVCVVAGCETDLDTASKLGRQAAEDRPFDRQFSGISLSNGERLKAQELWKQMSDPDADALRAAQELQDLLGPERYRIFVTRLKEQQR